MIEPYYDDGIVTLYHGDCREILPTLEARSFDLCLGDPPYGETSLAWDRRVKGWPALVRPLLTPAASLWVFGSLKSHLLTAGEFAEWRLAQDVIWRKHNGSGFQNDRFRRVHEQVVQWYAAPKWAGVYKNPQYTHDATKRTIRRKDKPTHTIHTGRRNPTTYVSEEGGPRLLTSVIAARSCHGQAVNETQKPLAVVLPLIEYSCPPGGVVLDPFAGGGTSLVAARLTGRRAIGIEVREAQCAAIVARLAQWPLGGLAEALHAEY